MISGSSTTWCYVADMDRALSFYRDFLGLTPGVVSPYWSEFSIGALKIGLHPGKDDRHQAQTGWILGLLTEDLAEVRRRAMAQGHLVDDYHQTPSGVLVTLRDPDGHSIQVMQTGSRLEDF